jgi:hypothetical protein
MNSSMGWRTVQGYYPNLGGQASVIFRIYFTSDGSTVVGGGFAFDDFQITDVPTQLTAFDLRTPTTSTLINVSGGATTAITLKWQKTTSTTPQPITYTWLTDGIGGNFANPTIATPANNNATDTTITFTYAMLDSIMNARSLNVGDTLNFIWTVRATNGAISRFANAPFALSLIRGIINVDAQNIYFDKKIQLYPNPTNAHATLDVDLENPTNITIKITNTLGDVIDIQTHANLQRKRININTKTLPSGMYFIHITDTHHNITKKLLVQH